ncbi:MAG: redoxin domain-containing protein [Desulfobacteraceae bacterium]|nr:redoxin domain-containing protein [Desulfobacteraceae bacterium]
MSRLQIAVEAPDFELNNFQGQAVSLSDFRDRKNVLLVFNRGFL